MKSPFTDIQIQPPLPEWSGCLQFDAFESSRLTDLRQSARRRLIDSAQQFVTRVYSRADDADLPSVTSPLLTGDPDTQSIVMTGHQPVVFHSGLTFKYDTTEHFAASNKSIGVAVIIDTDLGDAGQFSFPQPDSSGTVKTLAIDSLTTTSGLYSISRLRDADDLRALGQRLAETLRTVSDSEVAEHFQQLLGQYSSLAAVKATAMEANLITRWLHGIGSQMLEIPLSAIACFPEVLTLTADILKQPSRFATAYNAALDVYREENNIRNSANPFPNLKVEGSVCELPFWIINHQNGQRQALEVHVEGNVTRLVVNGETIDSFTGNISAESLEPMLVQNIQIVPRGALITAFLRILFSDLFVHGTGGGRYDRFTDEFMRSWWNIDPPAFTVASASRYLFAQERSELQRLKSIEDSLRELQYNPQRHLGNGVFSASLESNLYRLLADKDAAVLNMKQVHQRGESARDIGRQIQQITNAIRDAVNNEFEPQLTALKSRTPEQHDAIHCRTYPWFMFP